jgi:lipid-binding SYLF domain-containing protein
LTQSRQTSTVRGRTEKGEIRVIPVLGAKEIPVKTPFLPLTVASLLSLSFMAGAVCGQGRETATLELAADVLQELAAIPGKSIPPSLLADAQGVAIIPDVIKAGFVIGGRHGHGMLLVRQPDGTWSNPLFVSLTGGSVGWQIGVQSTDVVLVFKTRGGLERIMRGQSKLTLGADIAVAAGPVGRQAEASTDGQLKAEIYSYSRSRGLFAGLAIEGAALVIHPAADEKFYGKPGVTVPQILALPPMPMPITPVPAPPPPSGQWQPAPTTPAPQPLPLGPPVKRP